MNHEFVEKNGKIEIKNKSQQQEENKQ